MKICIIFNALNPPLGSSIYGYHSKSLSLERVFHVANTVEVL
jgi:hypothetical protein